MLKKQTITISLTRDQDDGVDARARPIDGLIALPAEGAMYWSESRLHRVVRHELGHVGLGLALDYASVPAWFDEGFAEWVAGGLSCEGEARIRLDLVMQGGQLGNIPTLFDPDRRTFTRLGYDYLGTFFEFLNAGAKRLVSRGVLVDNVGKVGVMQGIERTFGKSLSTLEKEWLRYLVGRYAYLPPGFTCPPSEIDAWRH